MMRFLFPPVVTGPGAIGLLALRVVAGLAMAAHGYGKILQPFSWMPPDAGVPGFLQFLAAFSEFFGGLAWVVGLLTPLASLGMMITMAVATLFHMTRGDPFVAGSAGGGSYERALGYLTISLLLMLIGPGRLSLDAILAKERG